jgi:predicted MFS family arabinose efflux permease
MIGRALLGIAIGGFWSMSAATAMRLVPDDMVPRALAILNGGNALATVIAAPMGSYLGGLIGWRGAFFFVVPLGAIVFVWQFLSLPSMKTAVRRSANVFRLLSRRVVALGIAAVSLFFMGQFALFTYLRPYLEMVAHVDVATLSLMFLLMGAAGFLGTVLIGSLLDNHIYRTLVAIPVFMALISASLILFGGGVILTAALLGLWGLCATSAPVAWWTWLARTLPDDAEAGGGLMVAVVQFAITLGAVAGGLLFDTRGYQATFAASALLLLVGAMLAISTSRSARRPI